MQSNLELAIAMCTTLPLDEKARLIKLLFNDSKLLAYFIGLFDREQIAEILRVIADYHVRKT